MSNRSIMRRARAKADSKVAERRERDERYAEYGPTPLCRDHRKPMHLVRHYCGAVEWRCSTLALDEGEKRLR